MSFGSSASSPAHSSIFRTVFLDVDTSEPLNEDLTDPLARVVDQTLSQTVGYPNGKRSRNVSRRGRIVRFVDEPECGPPNLSAGPSQQGERRSHENARTATTSVPSGTSSSDIGRPENRTAVVGRSSEEIKKQASGKFIEPHMPRCFRIKWLGLVRIVAATRHLPFRRRQGRSIKMRGQENNEIKRVHVTNTSRERLVPENENSLIEEERDSTESFDSAIISDINSA